MQLWILNQVKLLFNLVYLHVNQTKYITLIPKIWT